MRSRMPYLSALYPGHRRPQAKLSCMLLELGRCPGLRTGEADADQYAEHVAALTRCLDGGDPEPLLGTLREKMDRYAAEQRYEQAAVTRDRLEALSRPRRQATHGHHRAAGDLVLATPHPCGREVTVLRHGQLVSVTVMPASDAIRLPVDVPEQDPQPIAGPPPRHIVDELRLVARWLDQVAGEAEVVAVSGATCRTSIRWCRTPGAL